MYTLYTSTCYITVTKDLSLRPGRHLRGGRLFRPLRLRRGADLGRQPEGIRIRINRCMKLNPNVYPAPPFLRTISRLSSWRSASLGGGKGVVLLVRHVLDGVSLGQFACKRVPVGDDHEWLEKCLLEVKMLQTLSHPNLVSYRHAWLEDFQISKFGPTVPTAFILQQFCNAGDLHNYITSSARSSMTKEQLKDRIRTRSKGHLEQPTELLSPRRMQLEEIAAFFMDITSGVHYLHSNGFVHRDLKPSNCLLHRTGQKLRVLVSDFGEMQDADVVRRSTGNTGTISYCAPEALRRAPDGQFNTFTQKSDVFSLGMIGMVVNHAKIFHEEITDESTYSVFHVVLPFTIQKRRQPE